MVLSFASKSLGIWGERRVERDEHWLAQKHVADS